MGTNTESTAEQRVDAFLAALRAHEATLGPRSPLQPRGLAGVPTPDGGYIELMPEDVEEILAKAVAAG